jgi:predicted secreted hydrolase
MGCSAMGSRYYHECKMQNAKCRIGFAIFFAFCILHSAFAYDFSFPRDHGSHDAYPTEWWYFTGHLTTDDDHRYGFEVTFFRVSSGAPAPSPAVNPWELRNVALAHFAITDVDGKAFRYYEKVNRASKFTANAATDYLDVFNEGWRATTTPDGSWRLVAREKNDSLDLTLHARKPPAVHENPVRVKPYYSLTRLEAGGTINGKRARGLAWMDHEFGSASLRESQQGWDWYSVQLDNDMELMLYVIRRADGSADATSCGSLITNDGHVIAISRDQMKINAKRKWRSKKSGATYPLEWSVAIPALRIALTLDPLLDDQELVTPTSTRITYWEGAVDVSGSFDGVAVKGDGYVEMTGYDRAFRAP